MPRLIPTLVIASLLLSGPVAPSVASAAPAAEESFDTLTEQASEKYSEGDYDGAIALFERAYALDPEPNILFNIGRIYEESGNYEDAIVYYERFISEPQVDLDAKQVALDRRDLAQAVVEIQKKPTKGAEPETPVETPVETPTETTPPVETTTPEEPAETERKPRNMRPIGYGFLGVGAAALIGGAIVGGLAKGAETDFHNATSVGEARDFKTRGTNLAPAADGLFIAGGILAAAGIVMLLVPQRGKKAKRRERAMFTPQASPTQVGFGVRGRF